MHRNRRILLVVLVFVGLPIYPFGVYGFQASDVRLLVYTRNYASGGEVYVHDNIAGSVAAIEKLGRENGFVIDATDRPSVFTDENLRQYRAIVFSNSNNETFENDEQRAAFQRFIRRGGAFVGVHAASASEPKWPWFWSLVGGTFDFHPPLQPFTIRILDKGHPSTAFFKQDTWLWEDEFYFLKERSDKVRVLLAGEVRSLKNRGDNPARLAGQPDPSPLVWCQEFEGARSWYTALGHKKEHYQDPVYLKHLLGGILWAIGKDQPVGHTAGRELHVSVTGSDSNDGSSSKPLRSISAAAQLAQPGDVVTVHEGTYRERVTPPRGGESDTRRIVYRAAPGEKAVIKGSEIIRDWKPVAPGVWKATIPNSFFGGYNPYKDLIAGDWFNSKGRPHHTGEVYLNGKSLFETHLMERVLNPIPFAEALDSGGSTYTWFCESDNENTYIYANFHDKNPNEELVEINVRDSCFYPDQPGRNYITVRGFVMSHAATQWAAPTAEQIGLIGTHWSKGWIIENNVITDSKCSGITLGKDRKTGHNVWTNNPSKDGATHYNEVIVRALESGWSREQIGSHIVRNNTIYNCEQTGICGSLGAVFSRITNNHIHHIWAKRQFTGAEMAGIKIHAAIDLLIKNNRIHHAGRGLWMDWMAQGTRITGNICYENSTDDLFVEVNHGPFLVDNNLFLSGISLRDWSEGGAYVHNLFAGQIESRTELSRSTPYHEPHSTALGGLSNIKGGDDRFYNNILVGNTTEISTDAHSWDSGHPGRFLGFGLWVYDTRESGLVTGGNLYYGDARPYGRETSPLVVRDRLLKPVVVEQGDEVFLQMTIGREVEQAGTALVTTERLGKARIPQLPFENADGSPLIVDTDYFGRKRDAEKPSAGPFEKPGSGGVRVKVW